MAWKGFFIIFQGLSVAKNCLKPETVPLTMLGIKGGIQFNFAKTLKGHGGTGLKVSNDIDL